LPIIVTFDIPLLYRAAFLGAQELVE